MPGGMHGRGVVCGRAHTCHTGPPGYYEIRSVNAQVVRILLECILVYVYFPNIILQYMSQVRIKIKRLGFTSSGPSLLNIFFKI